MDIKEIGINTRNWVDLAQDRDLESPCECGIEPPDSISHGVSNNNNNNNNNNNMKFSV